MRVPKVGPFNDFLRCDPGNPWNLGVAGIAILDETPADSCTQVPFPPHCRDPEIKYNTGSPEFLKLGRIYQLAHVTIMSHA